MAVKASTTVTITAYRDTKSVTRYYKLVSATASAPTIAQTVKPSEISGLGWTDTEPTYTSDSTNILYFFDASVFSDDTWLYSEVSKSSSYEAAKEAYNKAQSAQMAANNAQTSIDNLEVGGRNLIVERNISNGWVNSSGTLINDSNYIATDYIPVTPGDTIVFQLWSPSSKNSWIDDTYFDSDKNYVTGYNGEYINSKHIIKLYTVPSGASYVRISYSWADGYKAKLEKGNKATDWTPAPEDVDAGIANAQTAANNSAKTATSYITDINGNSGIKVGAKNNANNYVQINSSGTSVYQDINNKAVQVASLGANGIVLGIDKNAQTIITEDGIKIANAGGIVGVSVDSSGITEVATKVVNVYANIRQGSSYTLTLDSSIASGTVVEFRVDLDGTPKFSKWFTITIGTNKSGTFSSNVQFTYTYNATNKQITITANQNDSVVLCFYRYDVSSDLPLVQLNGVLEFNGNQQKDVKIEVGTSGIWTYEKWSSGTIKCWTTSHWSTPTLTMTAVGNCYKSNIVNMPFPSDLFVNVDKCFNAQFNFKSAGTYLQSVMYTAVPNNNVLPVIILKGGSSTGSCGFSATAIGRWK